MFGVSLIRRIASTRAPEEVRDAYALAQYERLAHQAPLLYIAMLLIVGAALIGGNSAAPPIVRYGIPMLIEALCAVRLVIWLQRPRVTPDPRIARQRIGRACLISATMTALSSVWCIVSWHAAPAAASDYFPMFMALGAIAAIVCVSMSRLAVLLNLGAGMAPIAVVLLLSSEPLAISAGFATIITGGFLYLLAQQHHDKLIELLVLQQSMRRLADTDPLTGLYNRRALRLAVAAAPPQADRGVSLMLIDLDGFKPVNDRHGHAAGDEVLCEVARRLQDVAAEEAIVCRHGGDEFAVLLYPDAKRGAQAFSNALLASLARPMAIDGVTVQIGASLGMAHAPHDGETLDALLRAADRALYQAKLQRDDVATPRRIDDRRQPPVPDRRAVL